MFKISDFAELFCCSKIKIKKKIAKYTPMLKNYDPKKRKHFYSIQEANFIIKCIGNPPDNKYKYNLSILFPDLFK